MAVAMSPDGVAGIADAPHRLGEVARHFADQEEGRLHAFVFEDVQHLGRAGRQRTVVECDHHLVVFERQTLMVLHGAEPRMLGGIDHYGPAGAQRIGITGAITRPCEHRPEKNQPTYGCQYITHCTRTHRTCSSPNGGGLVTPTASRRHNYPSSALT